jgi:thymidylate synthase (FAD)
MSVKLISLTPDAEKQISYCARVSNPKNQNNESIDGLLNYCIKNHHWSIFEHANMTFEIKTTRAISPQLLRHRSFTFQEFSQRYSDPIEYFEIIIPELRQQATKNRQSSTETINLTDEYILQNKIRNHFNKAIEIYQELIDYKVARECARAILPLNTETKLYMTGNIRSWIHYIQLRATPETQKEHRQIAEKIKEIFKKKLPIISKALDF